MKNFLRNLGAGALAMYFFDPRLGRRRRALLRDKTVSCLNSSEEFVRTAFRDMGNRVKGLSAEAVGWIRGRDVPDEVLEERVRSRLGRLVSHPRAIEVRAQDGRVVLSGAVLAAESERLLRGVKDVRGVKDIEDLLEAHARPEDEPSLQGGKETAPSLFEETWPPSTRLIAGAIGGFFVANAFARGTVRSYLLAVPGLALLVRAVVNEPFSAMAGMAAERVEETRRRAAEAVGAGEGRRA
jgi:hypothetical protein